MKQTILVNKKKNIKIEKIVKPKLVYLPLIGYKSECKKVVNIGDSVAIGTLIAKSKVPFEIRVRSTVSGKIIDVLEKTYLNGTKVKCIVIENDFKETIEPIKIKKPTNQLEFVELLKAYGIQGMGGSGFPTYLKYQNELKILVVNAIECEPYLNADNVLGITYVEEIIKGLERIKQIMNLEKVIIAVKKKNITFVKTYQEQLKNNKQIELIVLEDYYPLGYERNLIKEVLNVKYKSLPSEKQIVVNNIATIYMIAKALKDEYLTTRIITLSGDLTKTTNYEVKIGTIFSDIYNMEKECHLIAGGPMMGECLLDDDIIVTYNLNGLLLMKEISNDEENCLRCGKCIEVCPMKLSPVLIKDSLFSIDKLKTMNPEKCIECGLCSYICPAQIKIRERIKEAKKIVREK